MLKKTIAPPHQLPIRTLAPGELYCCRHPYYIRTVLGSCIAVCLWEHQLHFGGMNHFILPMRGADDEYSLRFGDIAVPALIKRMLKLGGNLHHLHAKIFGGANVIYSQSPKYQTIGQHNADVAITVLNSYKIPIVASRLFGNTGLVICQCTHSGDTWIRPIKNIMVPGETLKTNSDTQI